MTRIDLGGCTADVHERGVDLSREDWESDGEDEYRVDHSVWLSLEDFDKIALAVAKIRRSDG